MENLEKNIKVEMASRELIDSYVNIFSHYLKLKGESVIEVKSLKDIIDIIKKTSEIALAPDDPNIEKINKIIQNLSPLNMSYYELVTRLNLLNSDSETPISKLRAIVFAKIEKEDPETAKEYIKSIL